VLVAFAARLRPHAEGLAEQQTLGEHGLELTGRALAAWRAYQHEHHDRSRLQADIARIQADLRALLEDAGSKRKGTACTAASPTTCSRSGPRSGPSPPTPGVEPTNNPAEGTLPGPVIHRKLSHGTRSDDGERFVERAVSVAATGRQLKRSLFDYLTELLTAHSRGDSLPALA